MAERILHPEFRDQYQDTAYPFVDQATMQSRGGDLIDHDIFIDASLHPIGANGYVFLSKIQVLGTEITITVSDRTRRDLASVTLEPLEATEILRLEDEWGRPAGILLCDTSSISRILSWGAGTYEFSPPATQFVPSCVIPTPEVGVRGIVTDNGDVLTGDVTIMGDNGVIVRAEGDDTIRIDVVGDPLFRRRLCAPIELFNAPTFVRTINGCPPDKYGNFNITAGDHLNKSNILRVYQDAGALYIEEAGARLEG